MSTVEFDRTPLFIARAAPTKRTERNKTQQNYRRSDAAILLVQNIEARACFILFVRARRRHNLRLQIRHFGHDRAARINRAHQHRPKTNALNAPHCGTARVETSAVKEPTGQTQKCANVSNRREPPKRRAHHLRPQFARHAKHRGRADGDETQTAQPHDEAKQKDKTCDWANARIHKNRVRSNSTVLVPALKYRALRRNPPSRVIAFSTRNARQRSQPAEAGFVLKPGISMPGHATQFTPAANSRSVPNLLRAKLWVPSRELFWRAKCRACVVWGRLRATLRKRVLICCSSA